MILSVALILPISQLQSRWWRHKLGHTWNM